MSHIQRSTQLVATGSLLASFAGAALCADAAQGAIITYTGTTNLQGTGFGTTLNVLSLQATPNEAGSVLRVAGADVTSGDATNQSQTRSVSQLSAQGVNAGNLALVFNIAEPGAASNVTLQGFTVRFTDNIGALLFDAVFSQVQVLDTVSGGVGGAGHRYSIALTAGEATSFFGTSTNRIGMLVSTPILNSAGAPESFFLAPAPGAGGLALVGSLALMNRRRRT